MELDFSKIYSLGSPQKPANEPKEVNSSKTFKTAKKPYNAVVKIGEKGYIDFISFSK